MNKKVLLIIAGIVVIGAGILIYRSSLQKSGFDDTIQRVEAGPKAVPGIAQVAISNFAFSPQVIKIGKGTKVVWTNKDNAQHTVTGTDKIVLDSPLLGQGKTFEKVFDTVGTYRYICTVHPAMMGAVIVVD